MTTKLTLARNIEALLDRVATLESKLEMITAVAAVDPATQTDAQLRAAMAVVLSIAHSGPSRLTYGARKAAIEVRSKGDKYRIEMHVLPSKGSLSFIETMNRDVTQAEILENVMLDVLDSLRDSGVWDQRHQVYFGIEVIP